MATLSAIRTRVTDHLRDTTGVWDSTVLNRAINAEYQFLYGKLIAADTAYRMPTTTISVTAGTTEYDLPAACAQIKAVADETGENPFYYTPISYGERHKYVGSRSYYLVGSYSVAAGVTAYEKIGVLDDTATTLTIHYSDYPTDMSADADVPLLPASCHELLSLGAAIRIKITGEEDASGLQSLYSRQFPDFLRFANNRQNDMSRRIKDYWE